MFNSWRWFSFFISFANFHINSFNSHFTTPGFIIYSNIHFSPISSSPSSSIHSPDSPTNSNPISSDTSVPLRRSTPTKQSPAWHNDYNMSFAPNHLTSSSSPSTGTMYPFHHYLSFSFFFPTQLTFLALIIAHTESKTYDEATGNPLWQKAMNAEIAALEHNHTWSLVPLPPSHKAIGCCWVHKIKYYSDGSVNIIKFD